MPNMKSFDYEEEVLLDGKMYFCKFNTDSYEGYTFIVDLEVFESDGDSIVLDLEVEKRLEEKLLGRIEWKYGDTDDNSCND